MCYIVYDMAFNDISVTNQNQKYIFKKKWKKKKWKKYCNTDLAKMKKLVRALRGVGYGSHIHWEDVCVPLILAEVDSLVVQSWILLPC